MTDQVTERHLKDARHCWGSRVEVYSIEVEIGNGTSVNDAHVEIFDRLASAVKEHGGYVSTLNGPYWSDNSIILDVHFETL